MVGPRYFRGPKSLVYWSDKGLARYDWVELGGDLSTDIHLSSLRIYSLHLRQPILAIC